MDIPLETFCFALRQSKLGQAYRLLATVSVNSPLQICRQISLGAQRGNVYRGKDRLLSNLSG